MPTFLASRIETGGRSKEAIIYSLSSSGAFLETPRASMDGAQVELCIEFPDQPIEVSGRVIFSNVTGNLQRPNSPLGIGVRFDDLEEPEAKRLEDYVESRLSQLEV